MARVDWNATRFITGLDAVTAARMETAAGYVEAKAKGSMAGGGSPHKPSAPGSPPNVDSGALRRSIEHSVITAGSQVVGAVSAGGGNVPYALAQEFGYMPRNLPPRPYLRPALHGSRADILRILRG